MNNPIDQIEREKAHKSSTQYVDFYSQALKASEDRRPAILIVGRVVALREHLRWFDSRPLFGKRILITRPRENAAGCAWDGRSSFGIAAWEC